MLSLYFSIALRRLRSDKLYSFINVIGLSVSIAVSALVFRYAHYELNYDSFFANADRIFRVTTDSYDNELVYQSAQCSQQVANALKRDFAEIEEIVQLHSTANWFVCTLRYIHGTESKMFNEEGVFFTDGAFFDVFHWPLIDGEPATALSAPRSAIISQSTAYRYFGKEPAVGKVLHLQGSMEDNDYTVTGVMPDLPSDSHLNINVLFSLSSLEHNQYAKNFDSYTYFLATPEIDIDKLSSKLPKFISNLLGANANIALNVLPIGSVHLDPRWRDEIKPSGNSRTIYFLLIVAAVVLLIALINYINLATGRALARAREVGIRKISGAHRSQVITQLLTESFILYFASFGLAAVLLVIGSRNLKILLNTEATFISSNQGLTGLTFLTVVCFLVLISLAAWYPARMISSFDPALVLKGKFMGSHKGLTIRRSLVVFQFICSVGLMTTVFVMHDQYDFMQNQDLGFEKSGMLIIRAPSTVIDETAYDKVPEFKKQLEQLSFVHAVTTSSNIPGQHLGWTGDLRNFQDQPIVGRNFSVQLIDPDYIKSYGLRLIAGRNLSDSDFPKSRRFGSKVENILLNEEAIGQLGYESPEVAIDKTVYWGENACIIVGVVADFHQESLQNPITPTILSANIGASMSIRLNPRLTKSGQSDVVAQVRKKFHSFFPDCPFDYFFLDDFFAGQYAEDRQVMRLFDEFCGLAILISCLGLFGLSLFAISQRMKELGIRKVLGATLRDQIILLLREFLWPVVLACLAAIPLLVLILQRWLDHFAFHIELTGVEFLVPVVLVMSIAILTVGFQATKASIANPADSLRHE